MVFDGALVAVLGVDFEGCFVDGVPVVEPLGDGDFGCVVGEAVGFLLCDFVQPGDGGRVGWEGFGDALAVEPDLGAVGSGGEFDNGPLCGFAARHGGDYT